jgi:hypothetical protein
MIDFGKLAPDILRWLLLAAYVPALNFVSSYILKRYVREQPTEVLVTDAEKKARKRIDLYPPYLTLLAFLLCLAGIILGRSLKLMTLSYLLATSPLLLLAMEFVKLQRRRMMQPKWKEVLALVTAILVLIGTLPAVANTLIWWHTITSTPQEFSIFPAFTDQMHMGDIGDVKVSAIDDGYSITYTPEGRGSHECDTKYLGGVLNLAPCEFGGVMFVNEQLPSQPGHGATDGVDLSGFPGRIVLEARTTFGTASVKFVIGGINWAWDEATLKKVILKYPDTMPHRDLGTVKLTPSPKECRFDLRSLGLQPEDFNRVIGGLGRTFTIEVRKARYVR